MPISIIFIYTIRSYSILVTEQHTLITASIMRSQTITVKVALKKNTFVPNLQPTVSFLLYALLFKYDKFYLSNMKLNCVDRK